MPRASAGQPSRPLVQSLVSPVLPLSGRWMISAKPDCCRRIRDGVKMAATHPTCIVSYKAASEKADPPAKGRVRLFAELRRGSW